MNVVVQGEPWDLHPEKNQHKQPLRLVINKLQINNQASKGCEDTNVEQKSMLVIL